MHRSYRIGILVPLAALALFAASGGEARAQDDTVGGERFHTKFPNETKGPFYDYSENELRARKLARGTANILLCPAEIPNQAFQEAYKTSIVTGAVVGTVKGVVKGVKRLGIGVWEVATFYLPMKNKYQPYIEPEVVMMEYIH